MKKLFGLAVLALFIGWAGSAIAADAESTPKEFISETMPEEVAKMVDNAEVYVLYRQSISTAGNNVFDYGIVYFVTPEDYIKLMIEGSEPPIYAMSIFALTPVRDEKKTIVDYQSEFVGVVFNVEKVRWFKSQQVKEIFEKATK